MSCYDDTEDVDGEELKGVDTNLTLNIGGVLSTTTTNGAAFCLNLIDPGVNGYQRIGDFVKLSCLHINLVAICRYSPAGDGGGMVANMMRVLVVWDKNPNASDNMPNYNQIVRITSQAGAGGSSDLMADERYASMLRFEILADKTILSSPKVYYPAGDLSRASETIHHWEEVLDLTGLETVYTGQDSSVDIGNIYSGGLYLYVRALVNTSGLSQWYMPSASCCRLRYTNV